MSNTNGNNALSVSRSNSFDDIFTASYEKRQRQWRRL
jgi:hypothetical protein